MLIPVTVMCLCEGGLRLVAAIAAADREQHWRASLWLVASGAAAVVSTAVALL
jgi:hypothetical protein